MDNEFYNSRGIENRGTDNRSLSPQFPPLPPNPDDIIEKILRYILPGIKWVVENPSKDRGGWRKAQVTVYFSYETKLGQLEI